MPRFTISLSEQVTQRLDEMSLYTGQSRSDLTAMAIAVAVDQFMPKQTFTLSFPDYVIRAMEERSKLEHLPVDVLMRLAVEEYSAKGSRYAEKDQTNAS